MVYLHGAIQRMKVMNTLEVIERCAEYLEDNYGKKAPFSVAKNTIITKEELKQAAALAPVLRGFCSSHTKMIGHFTDDDRHWNL